MVCSCWFGRPHQSWARHGNCCKDTACRSANQPARGQPGALRAASDGIGQWHLALPEGYHDLMSDESHIDPEDRALFLDAIGPVKPVKDERVEPARPRVSARPRHEVSFEEMIDEVSFSDLAEAPEQGEQLQYLRPGVQKTILRKLKRG